MYFRLLRNSLLFSIEHGKKFSTTVAEGPSFSEKLADAVTPLWRIPYSEQLTIKDRRNLAIIRKLTAKLKKEPKHPSGLICQLLDTIPSVNFKCKVRNCTDLSINIYFAASDK